MNGAFWDSVAEALADDDRGHAFFRIGPPRPHPHDFARRAADHAAAVARAEAEAAARERLYGADGDPTGAATRLRLFREREEARARGNAPPPPDAWRGDPGAASARLERLARKREERRRARLEAAGGDPMRVACFTSKGRAKVRFPSWAAAFAFAWLRCRAVRPGEPHVLPYRCAAGHVHVGHQPSPRRVLTGGKDPLPAPAERRTA